MYCWAILPAVSIGLLLYLLVFIFAQPITLVFNREHEIELTKIAVGGIRLYLPALLLSGFNVVTASLFASMSNAMSSFLISVSRGFVLIVSLVFFFFKCLGNDGCMVYHALCPNSYLYFEPVLAQTAEIQECISKVDAAA
ncbi:hypothetical protein [Hydrogenoanaerobacterium sp.]|uniref:hypothetical protein n=1 Tax=Hydrogenoanaerobacterium sp. TaxID=2953763 RepID=UPI0028A2BF21|nr:hypothetical protein [Hydrogenoanaerobacterium sp.]